MLRIVEPKVYLLSRPSLDENTLRDFLHDEGVETWETDTTIPAQALPEIAGRVCYMSFGSPRPGGNKTYLEHILSVGHGSVLEHSNFGFLLTGVSRSFTHELVRHRIGFSYSQLSQRYVDESQADFICPKVLAKDSGWRSVMEELQTAYQRLVKQLGEVFKNVPDPTARKKAARQAARSVLPNAVETKIFVTANVRAWRHFIEMRCSEAAEPEMRKVAGMILEILQVEAPALFGDYVWSALEDGSAIATTVHKKV